MISPGKFSPKIAEIKAKVQKLISLHRETEEKNASLLDENAKLRVRAEQQEVLMKAMSEKIKTIHITQVVSANEADKHQLKLRVNELIREVDKCISLLNS